jgi:two-component system, OmpR family, alkaline phosphatase synthesis response regulator PhoP
MAFKILVVDDEVDILEMLRVQLQANGFEVAIASNGREGLAVATKFKPITAMGSEENELKALELGADDFIRKPVTPALLMSRVKNLQKRFASLDGTEELHFTDLSIFPEEHKVLFMNEKVTLARKEFQLLHMLAKNPGKVYDRNAILGSIWGSDVIVGDRTVDVHVRKIRQKLNDRFIHTIKGLGYKFEQ